METRYLTASAQSASADAVLDELATILREGGIVAFPTETVYGLAVARENDAAVRRLYAIKKRPEGLPLTVHIADRENVDAHVSSIPRTAELLMTRYWPGPLTLILRGKSGESVGLRLPSNELARGLLRRAGVSIVATSANPHGEEPAVDAQRVRDYFDGEIEAVLDGGSSTLRQSSTIVQVDDSSYRLLREGIITSENVHQLVAGRNFLFVCTGNTCRSPMAEGLFRKLLAEKLACNEDELGERGYTIGSAGTFAGVGGVVSEFAADIMLERGVDLARHRTRPLTARMLEEADAIYALSDSHLKQIIHFDERTRPKSQLLADESITDPIGADRETYDQCADEIEAGIRRILETL